MRTALIVFFWLLVASLARAAVENINTEAVNDEHPDLIVYPHGNVVFRLHPNHGDISCTGVFTNAVGGAHKTFTSSIKVMFSPAAEGQSNPCTIKVITKADGHKHLPTTKTIFFRVIVPKMITRTLAHVDGAPDDRPTIGVGEQVMLTVEPHDVLADSQVTWHVSQVDSKLSNRQGLATLYTAGMGDYRKQRPGHPIHSSNDLLWMEMTTGKSHPEQAAEYSKKLHNLDEKLSAHTLDVTGSLVAIASMKTRSPTTGYQGSATQEQPRDLQDEEISIIARILLTSHLRIDPKFNSKNEPAYEVKPPKGYTLVSKDRVIMGSIAPEDIREAALRKQYEEAIAANDAERAYYQKQSDAQRDDNRIREYSTKYLAELYEQSRQPLNAFSKSLVAAGVDHGIIKEMEKQIKQSSSIQQ